MSSTAEQATSTVPIAPGRWTLDPTHSSVVFSVRHLGLSKVWGRFERFDAKLDVGPTPADASVEATIDMGSVNTNNQDRDAHRSGPAVVAVAPSDGEPQGEQAGDRADEHVLEHRVPKKDDAVAAPVPDPEDVQGEPGGKNLEGGQQRRRNREWEDG